MDGLYKREPSVLKPNWMADKYRNWLLLEDVIGQYNEIGLIQWGDLV